MVEKNLEIETISGVRACLNKEVFDNPTKIGLYYFFRHTLIFFAFSYLLLHNDSIYFLIPIWIVHSLNLFSLYQIGHDCAHYSVFKNRTLCYIVGQISFLPSLHPFHQWVFGHNTIHHAKTSQLKFDLAWHPKTNQKFYKMNRADRLIHKFYWSSFGIGMYYMIKMWFQGLIVNPAPYKNAKRDIVLVISFAILNILGILWFYDFEITLVAWTFCKLYLIPFVLVNYLIGTVVYLHHINLDVKWKTKKDWTKFHGQIQATTNFTVPSFLNFFLLNVMVHSPHHLNAKIPFYNLPNALAQMKTKYKEYLILKDSLLKEFLISTKNCKLIDEETGEWVRYV
ncbi:MAG: fatty acid desaturase [Leptospiraceae bacterium]|nr:fatty acid desaturase [Leptospiraceae bacterium]